MEYRKELLDQETSAVPSILFVLPWAPRFLLPPPVWKNWSRVLPRRPQGGHQKIGPNRASGSNIIITSGCWHSKLAKLWSKVRRSLVLVKIGQKKMMILLNLGFQFLGVGWEYTWETNVEFLAWGPFLHRLHCRDEPKTSHQVSPAVGCGASDCRKNQAQSGWRAKGLGRCWSKASFWSPWKKVGRRENLGWVCINIMCIYILYIYIYLFIYLCIYIYTWIYLTSVGKSPWRHLYKIEMYHRNVTATVVKTPDVPISSIICFAIPVIFRFLWVAPAFCSLNHACSWWSSCVLLLNLPNFWLNSIQHETTKNTRMWTGWWLKNHLEKWWSSSMGRIIYPIYEIDFF